MTENRLPDLIPLELLFGNPDKVQPRLSPDGRRMAFIAPVNDVLNVWVGDVGSHDPRPVTNDTDRGIRAYFWAYDNEHLLYVQDVGGNEDWHLYAVHLASGAVRDLTPFDGVQARVVDTNKDVPSEVLIGLNRRDPKAHDVFRLDIVSGELTQVAENPGNLAGWVADRQLNVRAALRARDDAGSDLLVRDAPEEEWRVLASWDAEDALIAGPLGFTKDGSALYVRDTRGANAARVVRMDAGSGAFEVLAEDPMYDVTGLRVDPDTYEPQAVAVMRERLEWIVLDESFGADLRAAQALHQGDLYIVSRDREDRTWLIAFETDTGPTPYYAFDRDTKSATFLFHNKPELSKFEFAAMEPISFPARDGMRIYGYISFPPGVTREAMPMVLLVHGGPWSRDTWGFDPGVQWLANRGYVVLQVNFRGSTGYGKEYVNAGDREWAGRMHDDLIDAVEWAITQGWVERARIGILGGSYGGYAALVGATFTPDVFACAVDIVGPSNIKTLIESIPPYWNQSMAHMLRKRVGDPAADAEFLWSRSPLSRVEHIKIPILIGQGANDPRVPQAESEQIVQAMKDKGIDHEYVLFPDEGHGFVKPENRLRFNKIAERFLAKHLGGRAED